MPRKKKAKKNELNFHVTYNSIDAALAALELPEPADASSTRESDGSSWDLGCDFAEAKRLAREGWAEVGSEVDMLLNQLNINVPRQEIVRNLATAGDEVDVGAFLAGEPEHFVEFSLGEGSRLQARVVTVVVDVGASCYVDAETIKQRGVYVCALVRALEQSGKAVNIDLVEVAKGFQSEGGGLSIQRLRLKRSDEHLDPNQLAFWLAHPAVLRRIFFRFCELGSDEIRDAFGFRQGHSYGCLEPLPKDHYEKGDILINNTHMDKAKEWQNTEDIRASVIEDLQASGVTVN